jgi:hypothetical protein
VDKANRLDRIVAGHGAQRRLITHQARLELGDIANLHVARTPSTLITLSGQPRRTHILSS